VKNTTSSGLLLLLVGVIGLSAFINGALPRLLETLFSSAPATGGASALVPSSTAPRTSVGAASVGRVA
jgi:hypothetical protein